MKRSGFKRQIYAPAPTPASPLCALVRRVSYTWDGLAETRPKADLVRSEPYRRLVAALPCKYCGIEGYSQAAHVPASGKGIKESDLDTFALCGPSPGVNGCHWMFDNYILYGSAEAREVGLRWAAETRAEIKARGIFPPALEAKAA